MDKDLYWLDYIKFKDINDIDDLCEKADVCANMLSKEYRYLAVSLYKKYLDNDKVSSRGVISDLDLDVEDVSLLEDEVFRTNAISYHLYSVCRKLARIYSDYYYLDDALLYINKAIKFCPGHHGGYKDKAEYLSKLGRIEEAIEVIENVLDEKFKESYPKWISKVLFTSNTSDITGDEYFKRYTYSVFYKKVKVLLPIYKNKLSRNYVYKPKGKKIDMELETYSEIKLNINSEMTSIVFNV